MSFDRYDWEQQLMRSTLKSSAKLVGLVLATHANNTTGKCWPAQPTLLEETSLTRNTLRAAVEELEAAGLLGVLVSRGRGHSTVYVLQCLKGSMVDPIKRVNGSPFNEIKGSESELKGSMVDIKGSMVDPQLLITTKETTSTAVAPEKAETEELTIKSITAELIEALDAMVNSGEYSSTEPYRTVLEMLDSMEVVVNSLSKSGKGVKAVQQSIVTHAWNNFLNEHPCPYSRIFASEKLLGPEWALWLISAMTYATTTEINGDIASYVLTTATNKKAASK